MRFFWENRKFGRGEFINTSFLTFFLIQLFAENVNANNVLIPPSKNLAFGRRIIASDTCGELRGVPHKDLFCMIAGKF